MGYVSNKRKWKNDVLTHERYITRKTLTDDNANYITQCNLTKMNRKCYVPYCKSGYGNCKMKYSIFCAPKDEEKRKEWGRAIKRIDRELTTKDCVCERHFKETDIIRDWQSGGIVVAYRRPRLAPMAVPSIFSYLTDDGTLKEPEGIKTDYNRKAINDCHDKNERDDDKKRDDINDVTRNDERDVGMVNQSLFDSIWNDEIIVTLPSRSWAIHYIAENTNKYIVISEMSLQIDNNLNVVRKMIINSHDLIIKTYIKSKEIEILNDRHTNLFPIDDVKDLEIVIESFNQKPICSGGPAISLNPDLDFSDEVATIEPTGIWRHVQCVFIKTNEQECCDKCAELFNAIYWENLTDVPVHEYKKPASKNMQKTK